MPRHNKKFICKKTPRSFSSFLIALAFILFLNSQADTFMIGLSTEELTRSSDSVISGTVRDTESFWSEDGKTILTNATVTVENLIKGSSPQNTIIVEHEGGEVGGVGLKVSDIAPLVKGEKVLLFLKSGPSRKFRDSRTSNTGREKVHTLVGEAQGKYVIDSKGLAVKGGFSSAAGAEVIDNNLSLEELIRIIKGIK